MSNDSSEPAAQPANQYAGVKWGPGRGILVVVITFVVAQLVALGVILLLAYTLGKTGAASEQWVNSTFGQFVFVVIAESLTLGLLWLLMRKRATWASIGFPRKPQLSDGGWALVAGVGYFVALVISASLLSVLLHISLDQKQDVGFNAVVGHRDQILALISLVLLPPVVEEILFRGVLFGGLRKKLPFIWATIITSLIFAAPHLLEANSGVLWIGGVDTFLLSLALCTLRERTGSLWAGIGLHMLKNGIAYLYLFVFVTK